MDTYATIRIMNCLFEQLVKNRPHKFEDQSEHLSVNEGIHFCVKVDADCMGFAKNDGNTHHPEWENRVIKYFHVIMLYPHSIYVCVSDKIGVTPTEGWQNTSNHDSCWRDGCRDLGSIVRSCWDEAFSKMPNDLRPDSIEIGSSLSLDLGVCGNVFELVSCTTECDYELDDSGYHKKLVTIKRLEKKMTI